MRCLFVTLDGLRAFADGPGEALPAVNRACRARVSREIEKDATIYLQRSSRRYKYAGRGHDGRDTYYIYEEIQ